MQPDTACLTYQEQTAFHYQELAFCVVMGSIAVINRDNPLVLYPDILWAFLALLGVNLGYQLALRRSRGRQSVPLIAMTANLALISYALSVSGGGQSSFWPMYLLPIFTACLYLELRHVLLAVGIGAAFLGYFYLEDIWNSIPWEPCELVIKAGVLALAAAVTLPLARRERRQRAELQASREKLDLAALALERKAATDLEAIKREGLKELAPRIAHDINNPLAVIIGSVELLMKDAPGGSQQREDLERIQRAAGRCVKLANSLLTEAAR
ncbi:MAG: hypothetical protein HY077_12650 [Elusimicrobia bacterium]|nr:hypothetical protein [Elusimicrobiota bacterium]